MKECVTSCETLNMIPAACLDIIIAEKHSFHIVFKYFEADGTTALILTGDFKMSISCVTPSKIIQTFTESDALSVAANELTIDVDVDSNDIPAGEYTYEIRSDDAGVSILHFEGNFTVKKVIALP